MNTNFNFEECFESIIHEYLISINIKQIFPPSHSPYSEIRKNEKDHPNFFNDRDKIKEYNKNNLNDNMDIDITDYSEFQFLSSSIDITSHMDQTVDLNNNIPIKIQKLYQLIPIFNLFFKYENQQNQLKYISFNDYLSYSKNNEINNIELLLDIKVIITGIIRHIKCRNYLLNGHDLKILIYEKIKQKININSIVNIDINDETVFNIWENISIPLSKFFKFNSSNKSIKNLIFNIIKAKCLIKSNNYVINNYTLNVNKFNLNINNKWLKIDTKSIGHDPNIATRIILQTNNNLLNYLKILCFGLYIDHNLAKKWKNTKMEDTDFFKFKCDKNEQKNLINEDTDFVHNSNNFNPSNIFKFLIIKIMNCSILSIELYLSTLINYFKEKAKSFNVDKKILYDLRKNDDLEDIIKLIKFDSSNNVINNNDDNEDESNKHKLIVLFPNYLSIVEMKNLFKLLNFYNLIICYLDNDYLNIETVKFINEVIEDIPKIPIIELNFQNVYLDYIKKYDYFKKYIDSYNFNNLLKTSYEEYLVYCSQLSDFGVPHFFINTNLKSISLTLYKKLSIIEKIQFDEDLEIVKNNCKMKQTNIEILQNISDKKNNDYQTLEKELNNNNNCIILQNFSAKFFLESIISNNFNRKMYFIDFMCFKDEAIVLTTDILTKNEYKILFNNFKHIKIIKFK